MNYTLEQDLLEALEENTLELSNIGFCLSCGAQQDGCAPDAQRHECDECGENEVYGAEEILLRGRYR